MKTTILSSGPSDAPPEPVGHSGQKSVGRNVRSFRSVAYATHSLRSGSKRSSGIVAGDGAIRVCHEVASVRQLEVGLGQLARMLGVRCSRTAMWRVRFAV